MAAIAPRPVPPSAMAPAVNHYRVQTATAVNVASNSVFASPTDSEFSETAKDSVLDWDETQVAEWLDSINCSQYVEMFLKNNINGENLLEMDQNTLKEMGVKKIGDRVRIGAQAKVFRNSVFKRTSKRTFNRMSLATLDSNATSFTPPSSGGSPRTLLSTRSAPNGRPEKRVDLPANGPRSSSRPDSPLIEQDNRNTSVRRQAAAAAVSPMDRKDQVNSYMPPVSANGRIARNHAYDTAQPGRYHVKTSTSTENLNSTIVGALPSDKPLIRVIFETGRSSVVNVDGFRAAEDIIRLTLRKGSLNENHFRSYCFYVLDGTDPRPSFCRRLGEAELCKLCTDGVRSERGRLILRKIHAGEPEGEQLKTAARIAEQQQPDPPMIDAQPPKTRSQLKIEKLTGEPLAAVAYPMSPASRREHNKYFNSQPVARHASAGSTASARARKLKDFYGARPPTELITQDLQSYFPEVSPEDMDRTVRMSVRRSQRLSKAYSRLSTASNFSVANSLRDAPPLPSIADQWLKDMPKHAGGRPLSVVRMGRPESLHRESVVSSILEPLEEESIFEPDRKSYVSFGADSGSDSATRNAVSTDSDGHGMHSYFDDSSPIGTEAGSNSLKSRLSQYIAEDGEELDEELMEHLERDEWDHVKYMKGAMIGQGSFGTVFLALHAVTGELMAVKQVETPSNSGTAALDAKKNHMIEALKREISLLRDLKHQNIVQYLGSNSDDTHLNIFLEYVAGGSVATMLVNYGSLGETLIANFVRQILSGLIYLHSKDIIHRDIKGANILVDNKGTVKISDFGISKRVEASTLLAPSGLQGKRGGPRVSLQGSVFWMAPEVVRQTAYTKKADVWSLGCLIVEMFTGSHPHPNCTQLQAIFKIGGSGAASAGAAASEAAKPDLPEGATDEAKEFLRCTFEIEHEKRPSAEELLEFDFVAVPAKS